MREQEIKKAIRESYAKVARKRSSCCASADSCCRSPELSQEIGMKTGYTEKELKSVPEGANLGLGCGNPVALSSLLEGETVLDLGSGAGLDCFLAAQKVGENGKVIGVDMTPEMIEKAREKAEEGDYRTVEFRLGEIENLPVADNSVDVVISNCVINLVPDKRRAFTEALRVLKPGGRLMISDIVLLKELPDLIKTSIEAYVGCLAGAMMIDQYVDAIREAGFREVRIVDAAALPIECTADDPTAKAIVENLKIPAEAIQRTVSSVRSVTICGTKPKQTTQ